MGKKLKVFLLIEMMSSGISWNEIVAFQFAIMNGIIEQQQNGAGSSRQMAEPLHLQRLEAALDMRPFMNYARNVLAMPLTSPDETEAEDSLGEDSDDGIDKMPGEAKKKKTKKLGTKQGESGKCGAYE